MPAWVYITIVSYLVAGLVIVLLLTRIDPEDPVAIHGIITWGYYFVGTLIAGVYITLAYGSYKFCEVVCRMFGKEIQHHTYADFW